jgi:hypothetical protein
MIGGDELFAGTVARFVRKPNESTADKAGGHSNALTVRWDRLLFELVKREIREIARKISWR